MLTICAVALFAAICLSSCSSSPAIVTSPIGTETYVKGGVVVAVDNDGTCLFKPFIKTSDTVDNPDTGVAQILGFSPGNVQIDMHGEVIFERVEASRFIPLNRRATVDGRQCACPPFNE